MPETSQQERTEKATAKRRADFREKGQVAQSKEVHTAVLLSTTLLFWFFYAPRFWNQLSSLTSGLWNKAGEFTVSPDAIVDLTGFILQKLAFLIGPLLLLVLVISFFSSFLQIGWLFTTKPLIPDIAKLDPIKGAKKFFSKKSLVEVIKSLAKVLLVGAVAYSTVIDKFDGALILVDMDVNQTLLFVGKVAALILLKCCGILIFLAVLDYMFVRWSMEQQMMMTKQETKEEFKEAEGDPHVKSRIRSIQFQIARKRMMAEVPKADVIITNPTHISVALAYRRGEMEAPQVVAKGADHLAMKIREIARENGVPIIENVPVARALHKVEIGSSIPEEMFKAVAEILAYVYTLKGN